MNINKESARLARYLTVKLIQPCDVDKQVVFTLRAFGIPRQGHAKLREEMRERVFIISQIQKERLKKRGLVYEKYEEG